MADSFFDTILWQKNACYTLVAGESQKSLALQCQERERERAGNIFSDREVEPR